METHSVVVSNAEDRFSGIFAAGVWRGVYLA